MKTYHEKTESARNGLQRAKTALERYIDSLPEVIELRGKILDKQQRLDKLLAECPHEETVVEKTYFQGGYDHQAYTEVETVCKTCGKKIKKETINHSWYS